ncbi:DUF1631 family protein [Marinobacter persicus]|uniref:Diguanylate cyclase/phosphodiesterase n=1 Tax=Marinobacter persicus TaxID=930118 RepID=A0A2S6G2W4_9GAMM|nr:DUF1631 family protein [Marinobacter persicus]PPK50014.1 diguanylate cyclase/phosphodiesterase [Marinobacter persicus]PPK52060.1 diguanylate cyclase/phosphodiesterase [Marinobacter persicus]PPK56591.1 diguanylate cyclase/phosphodiesterase [Marinobacter persicus]
MESRERRSSTRQPIKLAARIEAGDGLSLPCQIADFCPEGLFIRYSGETSSRLDRAFVGGMPEELVVRFRGPDGKRSHELHAKPARRIEGAMGVQLTRPNPQALDAMLQLCGSTGEQQPASLKAPSEQVQFVLRQSARAIIQFIEPLMTNCFGRTYDALQQAARKAASDQLANELMDASGLLQSRQRLIWQQMARHLESPLKPEKKGTPASLSVVDKNEFEDWLAIRVMVTRADTLFRGDLLPLKLRLDALGIANRTGHHNPLGPALVCEAFHEGLAQLQFVREVEKVCLKTFEDTVLRQLGPLYEELNNILVRQGVLPDLDLSRYLSEQTQTAPRPKKAEPVEAESKPASENVSAKPAGNPTGRVMEAAAVARSGNEFQGYLSAAQTAFATVRNLLGSLQASRLAQGQAEVDPFPVNARPVSPRELQEQLQELQVNVPEPAESPTSLRERVVEKIRLNEDLRLNEEQQDTLDVVDRFFKSVIESPRIGNFAQTRLRQLEVPVLKVVMRDPAFFEDQDSPVRGVMNRLAQLGVKGGRLNPVVQRRVDELVQKIATEFEQDTGIFEQTVTELDSLIDRQNLVYRRNVERVTAAAEGAQKVSESKEAVIEAVDKRLAGKTVPRAVVSLLDGGWRDLLSLTWIRQGPDSQLWQDYLAVIDSLVAFGEDPDSGINLPELLRLIQDGLASISSNHMPSSHIRDELKRFLVRKPDRPPEMVQMPAASEVGQGQPSLDEREQRSLQRWINRARQLRTGDWLRDQAKPDEPQYIRLVWVARNFGRFVFVNHQGMRVVELELSELARQMRKGIVVPDTQYDRPLVDESIDRMVRNVYDQLSWASTHDEVTHLLNRREFERMVEQQLVRHEDNRSLLHLDLRGFRLLSDTAGYQAADAALKQVADVLRHHATDGMPVGRMADTEFAMLVPAEQAETIAPQLVEALEAEAFSFDGRSYQLSANIGLVPELPELISAERWLRASDRALSAARKLGPGKVAHYAPDNDEQARQEQIAARVAGLSNPSDESMLLRCQKIIPLHQKTKMPAQYEVLISMYDDNGQMITGQDFVNMAERYDRMQLVDRWVVGHMLDWLRDKAPDPGQIAGVCINLSGHSLNDQSLLEFIYEKLSEKDAPIERLWFELTEASAIQDLQAVSEFMAEMQELGCRFCLANFGSGPGSFEFMRSLPVDLIKIDSAFTGQVDSSQTDQAMVKSMVDMAHYMKREVIASKVESRPALDVLKHLGVDYAQGFLIEKPRLLNSVIQ